MDVGRIGVMKKMGEKGRTTRKLMGTDFFYYKDHMPQREIKPRFPHTRGERTEPPWSHEFLDFRVRICK